MWTYRKSSANYYPVLRDGVAVGSVAVCIRGVKRMTVVHPNSVLIADQVHARVSFKEALEWVRTYAR